MADCMNFPKSPLEFLKLYEFRDKEEIYTNGSMLIPTFRVKQLIEHYFNSAPTADVQEVVRCKDCVNFDKEKRFCSLHKLMFFSSDFCNYGAKMDKECEQE